MKKTRLSVLTTLVLTVLNFPASADEQADKQIVYSQLPFSDENSLERFPSAEIADAVWQPMPPLRDKDNNIILDADGNIPFDTDDQMVADNFILTESDAIITGVKWWGGGNFEQSSDIDNVSTFTVTIFTSSDNAPDDRNVLYKETFEAGKTKPNWLGYGSFEPGALVYEHNVTLSTPLELCQDAEYWISIGATNFYPILNRNSYLWYGADPKGPSGDDAFSVFSFYDFVQFFPNPVEWTTILGDQAFELKGKRIHFQRATHCPDQGATEPSVTPDPTSTPTATSEPSETPDPSPTPIIIDSTSTPTATSTPSETPDPTSTPTMTTIDYTTSPTPTATPVAKTPIPAAVWLLGSGLAGLFAVARRRKSKV